MPNASLRCRGCKEYFKRETMLQVSGGVFCSPDCIAMKNIAQTTKAASKRKPMKVKQRKSKLMDSAKGKDCNVRIPGICSGNSETTVAGHVNALKFRRGSKAPNYLTSRICFDCHQAVDGQVRTNYTADELKLMLYEGVLLTMIEYVDEKLMVAND